MKAVFQQRRLDFLSRCGKYLRYVLNDHFVLVLMVFLGFLSLQYHQLLVDFPEDSWPVSLGLLAISLLLLWSGRPATYLEEADKVFLLPKEEAVRAELKGAGWRAFLIWSGLQVLVQLLFFPLYIKVGWPIWAFPIYLVLLLLAKAWLIWRQLAAYQVQGLLDWDRAIQVEEGRQQAILRFFSLFTTVKGITTAVKPRPYLNGLLGSIKTRQTWLYLYLRAFLRAGDYLGLTLRLFFLSCLALVGISESWLALGLVGVFHYLLLFQLLGLYKHYDYQYLTQLYPLDGQTKKAGFQTLLRVLLYSLLGGELVLALLFTQEKTLLVFLVLLGIFLHEIYLPLKLKKLID